MSDNDGGLSPPNVLRKKATEVREGGRHRFSPRVEHAMEKLGDQCRPAIGPDPSERTGDLHLEKMIGRSRARRNHYSLQTRARMTGHTTAAIRRRAPKRALTEIGESGAS